MDTIGNNLFNIIESVELLLENNYSAPSLILIYSGIDIAASQSVSGVRDVQKKDFIQWVERYMLNKIDLGCSADDIYSARCAVLHSYASESSMSRKNEAKPLIYGWNHSIEDINFLTQDIPETFIRVRIEDLFSAYKQGMNEFVEYLKNMSPEQRVQFNNRESNMLSINRMYITEDN